MDTHSPTNEFLRDRLKAGLKGVITSTADNKLALIRTVEIISNYVTALRDSIEVNDETGEIFREGLPSYTEASTREEFIDPILLALGWDVSKKHLARIELRIDYDRVADYVLFHSGGEAFAIVEAKNLYEDLVMHEEQLFSYMKAASADTGILTNGFSWRVYKSINTPNAGESAAIEMVLDVKNILEGLTEEGVSKFYDLVGYAKNYQLKKPRTTPAKPISPLDDGWVET